MNEPDLGPPHISHQEILAYQISEATLAARRWIPKSDSPNPIIKALQEHNCNENTGWLRAAVFGKDRVGCHNNDEEKKYIHSLYSPISRDYSCRRKFVKELSIAWEQGKQTLDPLLDTIDEKNGDKLVTAEVEMMLLECDSWTPTSKNENPFLDFLEKRNEKESKGWLRAALFGRNRVGKNQSEEESIFLSTLYSRTRLPMLPKFWFQDFARELSYAWDISGKRLKEKLKTASIKQPIAVDTSKTITPSNVEQAARPRLVTPSNENEQQLQSSIAVCENQEKAYTRQIIPSNEADEFQSSSSNLISSEKASQSNLVSQESQVIDEHFTFDAEPEFEPFEGLSTTAHDNIVDFEECVTTGLHVLTLLDSKGRKCKRHYMNVPDMRKLPEELENGRVPRAIKTRANLVLNALDRMDPGDNVLKQVAAQKGYLLRKEEDDLLTIEEAIVMRDHVGTTTNGLIRIDQNLRGMKGLNIFPKQLKKQIANTEKQHELEVGVVGLEMIISKQTNKMKLCNFSYLKEPHVVLERLVESCKISGKFEESSLFSSLCGCLVFPFGGDRGGTDYTLLVRLANRIDGNSGRFCQPVCQFEDGAECYENCAKGPFNPLYPIRPFLQDLVDDRLHAIVIDGRAPNDAIASKCVTVKVMIAADLFASAPQSDESFNSHNLLVPKIRMHERGLRGDDDAIDDGTAGKDRSLYLPLSVLEDARDDGSTIELSYHLLWKEGDNPNTFVGVQLFLYDSDDPVLSFRFDLPFVVSEKETVATFYHCIGIPAHDTKQGLILSGQGTASDSCCCLTCISLSKEFWKPQEWMEKYDQDNPILKRQGGGDAPLREGLNSNQASYERFKEATDDGNYKHSEKALLALKRSSNSVTNLPLLHIPPSKDPVAPMHAMQGHITHLLQAGRDELRAIDTEDSAWVRRIEAMSEEVERHSKESAEFKASHKQSDALKRKIVGLEKSIERQLALRRPNQNEIDELRRQISEKQAERKAHAQNSGYGLAHKLTNGAKKLLPLLQDYLKDSSRKSRGEAEFVYNRAIEILAGVRFRPERTGFELSNADGIKVLKVMDEIGDVVSRCYGNEPAKRELVKQVVARIKAVASPLYQLCLLLKSQKIIPPETQEVIRTHQCAVFTAWRANFPNKNVFLKMHHWLCGMPRFIEKYQMFYRVSEESFESIHPVMEKTKSNLKPMVSTEKRLHNMYRRFQVSLAAPVEAGKTKLQDKITKGPRGPYNASQATRRQESLTCAIDELHEEPEGYLRLVSGEIMKKDWLDVYALVQFGKAPEAWWNAFDVVADLGDLAKEKLKFSK